MLVLNEAGVPPALILNLRDPLSVLENVPSAHTLDVGGRTAVVLPHQETETRILNNMGIKAPAPIVSRYDWPGKFDPMQHQSETCAFLTLHKRCIVMNDIGTGKTQSALWAADWLMRQGIVKRCLIMAPLSTLERVWHDSLYVHFPHRSTTVLHGAAKRRIKRLKEDHDFYIVNHDGFGIISDTCNGRFDLVIVDEAAVYRNPSAQRTRLLRKWITRNNCRLWMMTGTPTPNEPTDAWSLARFMNNPHVADTFTKFRNDTMQQVSKWKWVPRREAMQIVRKVLQPCVRYTRDMCLDLPPTTVSERHVKLSDRQRKAYVQMMKDLFLQSQDGLITAPTEMARVLKLVQISCGIAYTDDGGSIDFDAAPRLNVVRELVELSEGKVIVFVPFTAVLDSVAESIGRYASVSVVDGRTSSRKRSAAFHAFQTEPDPRVLVAHPATMAHGLTLTEASTIVWYGPITSNEIYIQACGRVERVGKKHSAHVVHLGATEIERQIYGRLHGKQKLQGVLLDLLKTGEYST